MLLVFAILIAGVITLKYFFEKAEVLLISSAKMRKFIIIVVGIIFFSLLFMLLSYGVALKFTNNTMNNTTLLICRVIITFTLYFIIFFVIYSYLIKEYEISIKEKEYFKGFLAFEIILSILFIFTITIATSLESFTDIPYEFYFFVFFLLLFDVFFIFIMYIDYGNFIVWRRIKELYDDEIFIKRISRLNEYGSFVAENCEVDGRFLSDIDLGVYRVKNKKEAKNLKQGEKIDVFISKEVVDIVADLQRLKKREQEFIPYPKQSQ